jgi:hypothetical protein
MKKFYYDGFLTVNGKRISRTDVTASNGVIHFITDVIDEFANDDCTEVMVNSGKFTTLLAGVGVAGLGETLQGGILFFILFVKSRTSWELAGSWPGAGRELAGSWPGDGRELARRWPGAGRELAGSWPGAGLELAGCWPGACRELAGSWPGSRQELAGNLDYVSKKKINFFLNSKKFKKFKKFKKVLNFFFNNFF